jgi:molybdopterin synthase catalytic subunit
VAVRISSDDFDVSAELAKLTGNDTAIGGVAMFVGTVRGKSGGEPLTTLTLEHYPGMTEAELERIETEARERFELSASLIVHRVGELRPGDNIVLVAACAPHRQQAFLGAEFLMDYLKTRAPFWKKETFADGASRWVDARESDETAASTWSQAGR